MAFEEIKTLDADQTVAIGGFNKKLRKDNPNSVEGYYLGTREVTSAKSKSGLASIHFFQTPKGNLGVWGKTDMDRKLRTAKPGLMTKITFDKMVPTPNGEMYTYKVAQDKTNGIEVDGFDTSPNVSSPSEDYSQDDAASEVEEAYEAPVARPPSKANQSKVQELLNRRK